MINLKKWASKDLNAYKGWALILLVWGILYLPSLRTIPSWYGDETMTFKVSCDFVRGESSYYAWWNTFWSARYPYQKIYAWICGMFGTAGGYDILAGRFFNALLALGGGFVIYGLGYNPFGKIASLYCSFVFLTYYESVIHFRMCYPHNAVGIGVLIMTVFLLHSPSLKTDIGAGVGLAIAAGSHPIFIYAAIALLLCRVHNPKSWLIFYLPSSIVVFSSLLTSYLRFGKTWMQEDISYLGSLYLSTGQNNGSGCQGFYNLLLFVAQDFFHLGALLGIILSLKRKYYPLGVISLVCLILLTKNRANLTVFYYQAVIILPTLSLCWGRLYQIAESYKFSLRFPPIAVIMWVIPLIFFAENSLRLFSKKLYPKDHYWATQSCEEVEAVAAWLNERTTQDDTIMANENLAWLLKGHGIPILQMVTWYGLPTYSATVPRERFRFDSSLENTKFAVLGDIDLRWAIGAEPGASTIIKKLQDQKWPTVWQGPNYIILANPKRF